MKQGQTFTDDWEGTRCLPTSNNDVYRHRTMMFTDTKERIRLWNETIYRWLTNSWCLPTSNQWCLPTPKRERTHTGVDKTIFCRHRERHAIYWWPTIGIRCLPTSKKSTDIYGDQHDTYRYRKDDIYICQNKADTYWWLNRKRIKLSFHGLVRK